MNEKNLENQCLVSARELSKRLCVSISSIYQWRKTQGFPARLALGAISRWRWSDVESWLNCRLRAQTPPAITSPGRPRATAVRNSLSGSGL